MESKKYATPAAFRRALEDRLQAIAMKEGVDLQRLRRQVAFDRLLARLFQGGDPKQPSSAMLASAGETIPPWGVPSVVS
jgi:hypothetical protein